MLTMLAACQQAPVARQRAEHEQPVLRVLYRDGHDSMLRTLSRDGGPAPDDECHAALLIDGQTGAARRLSRAEADARTATMQLAGATPGTCPG
ncbi:MULTISPECIES: hypothetical protein [unclassified Novosphingobium]|uniref:hypothetical protein n=1 Tax=Novosphingobium TaxID=165696 RepID=UPI00146C706B|nr:MULTISPECIES: hypothetical protein [unclassified Novosphingobium]NMN03259.1 hypothetical protein [Novosphingobium sp. SG919]NMN86751.1 hypothetical protein [Novosphingobium sp. SG916]